MNVISVYTVFIKINRHTESWKFVSIYLVPQKENKKQKTGTKAEWNGNKKEKKETNKNEI
jgi:hypothetical protein